MHPLGDGGWVKVPWDCLVVGGGPAGSTVANLLAEAGHAVLLVERETFPRYHIGESLLPGILPILDRLGVREAVEAAGFHRKTGQTFLWAEEDGEWDLVFNSLEAFDYSYFVDRSHFDALLLDKARDRGAEVWQGRAVHKVLFEGDRATGAMVQGSAANELQFVKARYVVDATGSDALLARHFRLRRFSETMKSFALWTYYENFAALEGHRSTHIYTVSVPEGWIWAIPLSPGRHSVGLVTARELVPRRLGQQRHEWFERILTSTPAIATRLAGARRVSPVRVAADWSYRCTRRSGPGWLLAGDAAGFIDPILSTGVHHALNTGYLAAAAVHSALRNPALERELWPWYDDAARALYDDLFHAVSAFYEFAPNRESLYWRAKSVVGQSEAVSASGAFVYIAAGLLHNQALGGSSQRDTLRHVGLAPRPAAATLQARLHAARKSAPGELQRDLLVGEAPRVVRRGVLALGTPELGASNTMVLMQRGIDLWLESDPDAPSHGSDPHPSLLAEVVLELGNKERLFLRLVAPGLDVPAFAGTAHFNFCYSVVPPSPTGAKCHALMAALQRVAGGLANLPAPLHSGRKDSETLVSAFEKLCYQAFGKSLNNHCPPTPPEASGSPAHPSRLYRTLVLEAHAPDSEVSSLWVAISPRQADPMVYANSKNFAIAYRPGFDPLGQAIFERPECKRLVEHALNILSTCDDIPGLTLQELAHRLVDALPHRLLPPAPWQWRSLTAINTTGAPKQLWPIMDCAQIT